MLTHDIFLTSKKVELEAVGGSARSPGLRAWRARVRVVVAVRRMLMLVKQPWAAGGCPSSAWPVSERGLVMPKGECRRFW